MVFLAGFAAHPPMADPWDVSRGLAEVAAFDGWKGLHLLLSIGLILWLIGLAGCTCLFSRSFHVLRVAISLFVGSLAKWLLIMSAEVGMLPGIVRSLQFREDPGLRLIGKSIFTSTILASYAAMLLIWLATILIGSYLAETGQHSFFPRWGIWAGSIGIAGIISALLFPAHAVIIAPATSAPSFIWTLAYGWRFASGEKTL